MALSLFQGERHFYVMLHCLLNQGTDKELELHRPGGEDVGAGPPQDEHV